MPCTTCWLLPRNMPNSKTDAQMSDRRHEGTRSTCGPGPAQLLLMSRVARSYYLDGRSKSDIAAELNISRFRVARLLEASRQSGLVRIVIEHQGSIDPDLSMQLQSTFGLANAVVIDIPDDDEVTLRRPLGEAAAELLQELVTADDVLGLAWARSLSGIGT